MMITSRNITDAAKLTYLIQHCKGKAKCFVEDCVMMTLKNGFENALQLFKIESGKKNEVACSFIDLETKGSQIEAMEQDGQAILATELEKCQTTLCKIIFDSDIKSTQWERRKTFWKVFPLNDQDRKK